MTKTIEELEAKVRELEAQLERMHSAGSGAKFAAATIGEAPSKSGSLTILGIEEMIIEVGDDGTIGYVNGPMAKILKILDRKKVIGEPLQKWDRGGLGEGVLAALVDIARSSGRPHILERECPELDVKLLPPLASNRPATSPILRFSATPVKGHIQIVAQEITLLRWLENTFSRYVPPAVIQKMQCMNVSELMKMERRTLTILFGDLRGFTGMSQLLPPEEVQQTVNSFLERIVLAIERNGGMADKFLGDGVMALFGAPLPDELHALGALCAAVEMQESHSRWMAERKQKGLPAPALGVGVATGEVLVGNMGTQSRMEYTALGHPVNLAARLCAAAEGGEILTVADTYRDAVAAVKKYSGEKPLPRFSFAPKGKMSFKNIEKPVEVISVTKR